LEREIMPEFYKITLVVESDNMSEAENLGSKIAQRYDSTCDVWYKDVEDMTDWEILKFFGKTKKEMNAED